MKIALFSAYLDSHEGKRYKDAAKQFGHELTLVPIQSLIIELSREGKISLKVGKNVQEYADENEKLGLGYNIATPSTDLTNFDAVIERGGNRTGEPTRAKLKLLIYKFYKDNGIYVFNGASQTVKADNKLWQHFQFAEAGVPVVPTKFVASENLLEEATSDMEYPIFVKEERGSHGVKTAAPKNLEELKNFWLNAGEPVTTLIQRRLDLNWDVRVLVVGQKVLGGMKRTAAEGSHVSNFSAGGSIEKVELTDEEKQTALNAAKSLGAEYGGADLMRDSAGKLYVLEFNRNASFKGFEMSTGVDVPKEVFDYIETQVKK